jgi:hypothetical protein
MSTDTPMQLGMIGTAMQAITIRDRAAGVGALSLTEMPYPRAAENDVIVRVHAAGFTPGELDWPGTWTDRAGRDRTPSVPGHELSGVVAALGYGTTGLTVGQRVFGPTDWTRNGSLAEYAAVEARNLAPLPADVDHIVAAALPISGLTAWQGLFDHGRLATGQTLALSARSGKLAARIGPRLQMSAGPVVVGTGLAMLTLATHGSSYVLYVLPAVVVFGLGLAITVAPLTATAMNSAPAEQSDIASAVNNDVARFGGLLAVAALPALAGITGAVYLHPHALAAGFRTGALISGVTCAAGGALAAFTVTNPPQVPRPAGAPAPEQCLHCGLDAPPLTTSVSQRLVRSNRPPDAGAVSPDGRPSAADGQHHTRAIGQRSARDT